jgi:Zn-dependent protease with chaperone function
MEQVMQLSLFLMILLSLSSGTIRSNDFDNGFSLLASLLAVACVASMIHWFGNQAILAIEANQAGPAEAAKRLERRLGLCRWIALATIVFCLHFLGLGSEIVHSTFLKHSLALQSLLLLLPGTFLFLFMVFTAERFEWKSNRWEVSDKNRFVHIMSKFRFILGTSLFPILLLLGFIDVIAILPLDPTYAGTLTIGLVLIFIALILPWIAGRFIDTKPLSEGDSKWISDITRAAGLGNIDIAIWNTNKKSINALVIGFVSPFRKLLVSDQLISQLPRKQVAMVVLHEAAHLKRKHLPIRMASIVPIWGIAALISPWFEQTEWFSAIGSVLCISLTLLTLRWVAHHTEHDADLEACRLAASMATSVADIPADQDEAGRQLCKALLAVTTERSSAKRSSWMHPGVLARIQTMRAVKNAQFLSKSSTSGQAC